MSIKIENIEGPSIKQWEAAIRGMRNPMNSWAKSDTTWDLIEDPGPINPEDMVYIKIGEKDLDLMRRLAKAGSDHRKYLRMLPVMMDITAPVFWIAEHDTYKVGTVRNSCSFMHRGCAKPFDIRDFTVSDERVYGVLSPIDKPEYPLHYRYETDDYRIYQCSNGREYKVFRNGRVVSCPHGVQDTLERHRKFRELECSPSQTANGYYELNIGGRSGEKWMLHRLVAHVWIDNPKGYRTVNHIDGDKGNNSVENLEWCSLENNVKKGFNDGLMDNVRSLHSRYLRWKNGHTIVDPYTKSEILCDHKNGLVGQKLADKYGLTVKQVNNMVFQVPCEERELFLLCYVWENTLEVLNSLREEYLETKDEDVFQQIRGLLPSGYNQRYTWSANYEVLWNMYQARKNHRLKEWREFCSTIVKEVPYFKEIFEIEVP